MEFVDRGSNSAGQAQNLGKMLKTVFLNSHNSFKGSPGSSLNPMGVHSFMTLSPKKHSLASFTAKVGAFDSTCNLW